MDLRTGIVASANALGVNPLDLATAMSYESGFRPDVWGGKGGKYYGLIQFGPTERAQYGVDTNDPIGSQLGENGAVVKYLRGRGVKPGMGLLDIYSTINAGSPGRYNASDAGNGGAPGTVRDKVEKQMAAHRDRAARLLGGELAMPAQTGFTPPGQALPQEKASFADPVLPPGVDSTTTASVNPLASLGAMIMAMGANKSSTPQPALNAVARRASAGPQVNTSDPLNLAENTGGPAAPDGTPITDAGLFIGTKEEAMKKGLLDPIGNGPPEGQPSLMPTLPDMSGMVRAWDALMKPIGEISPRPKDQPPLAPDLTGVKNAASSVWSGVKQAGNALMKPIGELSLGDITAAPPAAAAAPTARPYGGPDARPMPGGGGQVTLPPDRPMPSGPLPAQAALPPDRPMPMGPMAQGNLMASADPTLPASAPAPTPRPANGGKTPFDTLSFLQAMGSVAAALGGNGPAVKPVSLSGVLHQPNFQGLPIPRGLL